MDVVLESDTAAQLQDGASASPHLIRITNHGKLHGWIDFALEFFKKNEERPLVLHTLPASNNTSKSSPSVSNSTAQVDTPLDGQTVKTAESNRMPASTATIPRLISVVEIIKREYLKSLDPSLAESGSILGLHQYNELGNIDEEIQQEPRENSEEARQAEITQALQGKNHLRQRRVAFMKVTLCRKKLSDAGRATYQKPAVRKLSKSARARIKRRNKGQPDAPP